MYSIPMTPPALTETNTCIKKDCPVNHLESARIVKSARMKCKETYQKRAKDQTKWTEVGEGTMSKRKKRRTGEQILGTIDEIEGPTNASGIAERRSEVGALIAEQRSEVGAAIERVGEMVVFAVPVGATEVAEKATEKEDKIETRTGQETQVKEERWIESGRKFSRGIEP